MYDDIPQPTVRRLSSYMRKLEQLDAAGQKRVSSGQLARHIEAGPDMVRRDLTMFGQFGRRGRGYDVQDLLGALRVILGTQQGWNVVLVGAGNLGRALMEYPDFAPRGFRIVAAFDSDPAKVGEVAGVPVLPMDRIEEVIPAQAVRMAILTVPPEAADEVVARLGRAGVQGILNFASSVMEPVDDIYVENVDISGYLEHLSFRVSGLRP